MDHLQTMQRRTRKNKLQKSPGSMPGLCALSQQLLIKNKGKVFSISKIYENVWEEESYGAENIIAVHIRHIREKIEINPREPKYLKVIWGIGYKIENI